MSVTAIAIYGAAGRMGRRLISLAVSDPEVQIVAAVASRTNPEIGKDIGLLTGGGELGVTLADSLGNVKPHVVIDFSVAVAAETVTAMCLDRQIPLVMATTGWSEEQRQKLQKAAELIPIVWSPSMSMTVNLAMKLAERAGLTLKNVGGGVDVEITERHHRTKADAPSGTALRFGEIIAGAMGQSVHRHGREGQVRRRLAHEIGYHAIRTGNNPGEHTIIFGLLGETLEITVKASNRDCYAAGALAAAKFVVGKPPGLYSMNDVLGLG
jgi:4-hydroxy-tetrahydrodipicolinate reductase